jgi:hypothetical protein
MSHWLFSWKGFVSGAGILLVAVVVAIVFQEGTLGNIASIVGLAVSVLGFVVTIWTVLDAREQIKDATDRAEKAVAQATEETRRAVEGIAGQLRASDCASLRHGVEDIRQAARDKNWSRALYRCEDSQILAFRLAADQHLSSAEALTLRTALDELRVIQRFIERNRLAGQAGSLRKDQLEALDAMVAVLAQIQARFHHESLRPTSTPRSSP